MKETIEILICPQCHEIFEDENMIKQEKELGVNFICSHCKGLAMQPGLLVIGNEAKNEALDAIMG